VIQLYISQLSTIFKENDNVILSGENISHLSTSGLVSLKKYILSFGFELSVLCSVRKPYSFFCSATQQMIKGGNHTIDNPKYYSNCVHVEKFKKVFNDISFGD
jgi:hypothetical protein